MSTTTPHLPEAAEWMGSPQWLAHLLRHDTPAEGCPGCAVQPFLAEIHTAYFNGMAVQLYAIQDGYGEPGFVPEQGMDYSGVRDSSPAAVHRMWRLVRGN